MSTFSGEFDPPHQEDKPKQVDSPSLIISDGESGELSPLSRLAENVENSRTWAPVLDRWQNHCEWLVHRHRQLQRRFRKTTAADRLSGVLQTIKCTRERTRDARRELIAAEDGKSYMGLSIANRDDVSFDQPLIIDESNYTTNESGRNETGVDNHANNLNDERTNSERHIFTPIGNSRVVDSERSSTPEHRSKPEHLRRTQSPERSERSFVPDDFRTSTPNAAEAKSASKLLQDRLHVFENDKDDEDNSESARRENGWRTSEWKDYIMSHDPILFRSFVDARYPKRSWRHAHQKIVARNFGKPKQSRRLRKPPTPKCLQVSWTSLDDMVQNEGILKSPLHLSPVLPGSAKRPSSHGIDIDVDDEKSDDGGNTPKNTETVDNSLSEKIGEGIRALRKECTDDQRRGDVSFNNAVVKGDVTNDSLLSDISFDETVGEESEPLPCLLPIEDLSDISLVESLDSDLEEGEIRDDSDDVDNASPCDVGEVFQMVNDEMDQKGYDPDGLLSETSYSILEDLSIDAQYPPTFFRAGFADRAQRRTRHGKVLASSTAASGGRGEPEVRRIEFVNRVNQNNFGRSRRELNNGQEEGTKFYPSDIRFFGPGSQRVAKNKPPVLKVVPTPLESTKVKQYLPGQKRLDGSSTGVTGNTKEDKAISEKEAIQDGRDKGNGSTEWTMEKEHGETLSVGKNTNQPPIPEVQKTSPTIPVQENEMTDDSVPLKIPVVIGRRPSKPSQDFATFKRDMSGSTQGMTWTPGSGDNDNGGVVTQRVPQLRRIEIQQGDAAIIQKLDSDLKNESNDIGSTGSKTVEGMTDIVETPKGTTGEFEDGGNTSEQTVREEARQFAKIKAFFENQNISTTNMELASNNKQQALIKERLAFLQQSYGSNMVILGNRTGSNPRASGSVADKHDGQNNANMLENPSIKEPPDINDEQMQEGVTDDPSVTQSQSARPAVKSGSNGTQELVDTQHQPETENKVPQPLMTDPRRQQYQQHPQNQHQTQQHYPRPRMPASHQLAPHLPPYPGYGGNVRFIPHHPGQQVHFRPHGPVPMMNAMSAMQHHHQQQQRQMAIRMASQQYINHQHQMILRHNLVHVHGPPRFVANHPHAMNGYPGLRPGFRMPRPVVPNQNQPPPLLPHPNPT